MKKPLLIAACFLFASQALFAQYRTMFENGAAWYAYYQGLAFGNTQMIVEGDSLINGKLYQVVNYYEDQDTNVSLREHFREDAITQQVFKHHPRTDTDTIELLLFDFSLSVGDTVTVYEEPTREFTLVLDSISSTLPYNCFECEMAPEVYFDSPKVFYLGRIDCPQCGPVVWLEGVGGLTSPFNPIADIPRPGIFDDNTLLCHYSGMDVLDYRFFHPDELSPCVGILSSVSELSEQEQIAIYPNPSSSTITIQAEERLEGIEVYDIYGRLHRINASTVAGEVDISSFSDGLLILRITTGSGQTHVKRVIKK